MKQRLIDANALIDTFETKKAKAHEKSIKHLYGQNKNDKLYRKDCETESRCEYVLSVFRTTPTVDAVQVVRCKECKHRIVNEHYGKKGYFDLKAYCKLDTGDIFELGRNAENDDWFCADGERKTE